MIRGSLHIMFPLRSQIRARAPSSGMKSRRSFFVFFCIHIQAGRRLCNTGGSVICRDGSKSFVFLWFNEVNPEARQSFCRRSWAGLSKLVVFLCAKCGTCFPFFLWEGEGRWETKCCDALKWFVVVKWDGCSSRRWGFFTFLQNVIKCVFTEKGEQWDFADNENWSLTETTAAPGGAEPHSPSVTWFYSSGVIHR